jgi:hypothetical protein
LATIPPNVDQPASPPLGNGIGSPSDLIILKGLSFPWEQLIGQNVPPTDLEASPLVQLAISMLAGMVNGIPTMVQLDDQGRLAVSAVIGPGAQVTILGTPTVDIAAGQSVAIDGTPTVQFAAGQNVGITGTITVQFAPGQTVAINGTATVQFAAGQSVAINGTPTVQFAAGQSVQITSGTVNVQTGSGTSVQIAPQVQGLLGTSVHGSTAGPTTIVTAVAGQTIKVYQCTFVCQTPTPGGSVIVESDAGGQAILFGCEETGQQQIDLHGYAMPLGAKLQFVQSGGLSVVTFFLNVQYTQA